MPPSLDSAKEAATEEEPPPPLSKEEAAGDAARPERPSRSWSETIFPMKLYDILCHPDFSHAISWLPHGRSWKVLNKEFFMEEICPHYFSQTRYESFIRQVNGWGFKRLRREGPDRASYYHDSFLRGYPHLIERMRRPAPGEKTRAIREEPDLYALAPLPPLPPRTGPSPGPARASASKVGRPAGARSSFDAVSPRGDYPPLGGPWGPPPPYYHDLPPPHQGYPVGPPGYYPPPGWGPPLPPPGWGLPGPGPPLPSSPMGPTAVSYPPPFYGWMPPPGPPYPSTPQYGRPGGEVVATQTPGVKRAREEEDENEERNDGTTDIHV